MIIDGVPQREIAAKLGCSRSAIKNWRRHPGFNEEYRRLVFEASSLMAEKRLLILKKTFDKLSSAVAKRDFNPVEMKDKDLVRAVIEIGREIRQTTVEVRTQGQGELNEDDKEILKVLRTLSKDEVQEKIDKQNNVLELVKSGGGKLWKSASTTKPTELTDSTEPTEPKTAESKK